MKWENDTFGLVLRMRQMVYSSKEFNIVDFCHDSSKYASIMALTAPKVESHWFFFYVAVSCFLITVGSIK